MFQVDKYSDSKSFFPISILYFYAVQRIIIINGPNLNLLGKREPEVYGYTSFDDFLDSLRAQFPALTIDYFQSNHEGELIDCIQQAEGKYEAIVINPGGFTHTSVAIADALKSVSTTAIEVHISNISAREPFRAQSITSNGCDGMIAGLGLDSYKLAIEHLTE